MHTIKITPNLLFEHQYTSGRFIRLANRIETFFTRIGMLYYGQGGHSVVSLWSARSYGRLLLLLRGHVT